MTKTASGHKTGDFTEPHPCSGCRKVFYAKASWNRATVRCPRCGRNN
jgi:hypothetical protein